MRIGLISDTHIPEVAQSLPLHLAEAFKGVDLILHAGDIYYTIVLDELERIAPVLAAYGDDDPRDTWDDNRVKQKHVLEIEGKTLWLVHEWQYFGVDPLRGMESYLNHSQDEAPDIVVFGHEHRTVARRYGNILFVNPGSATFLNYRPGPGTVAILNIDSLKTGVDIIRL